MQYRARKHYNGYKNSKFPHVEAFDQVKLEVSLPSPDCVGIPVTQGWGLLLKVRPLYTP